jgi:pimeloyl-ACP methyl ester carboxylesterase
MKTWQRQTKDFGHAEADKYTCLVFDNRGIGSSDKPILRYTTSEMARDVIELLDHVGWTEPRSVHVVAISMGGMIAQELASTLVKSIDTELIIDRVFSSRREYAVSISYPPHHA